jgi:hypothetical protein
VVREATCEGEGGRGFEPRWARSIVTLHKKIGTDGWLDIFCAHQCKFVLAQDC